MINDKCPVCKKNNATFLRFYRGKHQLFSGLKLAECYACGMVFTTPMLNERDLLSYNATYFTSAHGGTPNNFIDLAFFSAIAQLRVAYIENYLTTQQITVSRILEFGPGPGFFAASWLKKYPETTYMACETDISCHDRLQKLGVTIVDADSFSKDDVSVDLVVMSHVLEHVAEPKIFVENATTSLRRGGVLFVEVPCLDFQHKSTDEPHLLFFDKGPMKTLLNSMDFDNIKLSYFGQEIEALRSHSALYKTWMKVRTRLIKLLILTPFSYKRKGMEVLSSPLERAVVAPFKAHCESERPAWWLRVLAQKV